jgi:two-component system, OmpR family, phosphate regulon sensor histidine kinase PhoR
MSKRVIQTIIVLMSISLLGITIIQYVWLKRGSELNEKNFDDKVVFALNRVKQQVEEDANSLETLKNLYNQRKSTSMFKGDAVALNDLISPFNKYRSEILQNQIGNTAWMIEPSIALNAINIRDVETYLKTELTDQDIELDYDYGIYSNKEEDFIIANGSYTVTIDNDEQFSQGDETRNLYETEYEVNLFSTDGEQSAGLLKIFFPKKNTFLLSTILPSLISSIVFTGLILFCFIYAINIILTQKKVSLMKTDFINNMTHEFKTPIATISLAVDSINNPIIYSDVNKVKRFAGIIKEENNRMLNQVEKVLQIAKLDKQDFELKISEVDINELAKLAVEHTSLKVNQRGGVIKAIIQSKNSLIKGDENHISNVIHNLLDNADKYSSEIPDITVETIDVKEGVEIIVKDKGIGMAKDDIKRIFEKFYRVSTGNIHNVKGFGLGLSYVKAIVDAHRGKIMVKSELGKGSEFTVFFPRDSVTYDQ